MKKFDGILFVSDLDDTLLDNEKNISEENKRAIEYFESEGGKFTFITGRIPLGIKRISQQLTPNIPIGCMNGGALYDVKKNEYLWKTSLDEAYTRLLEFVSGEFATVGIEVCSFDGSYFCRKNEITETHRIMEHFPDRQCHYNDIKEEAAKVVLMDEAENIPALIKGLANHVDAPRFDFIRSTSQYYEILPKGASKGNALLRLAKILEINPAKTISIGDNDNDVSMLKAAKLGFAVDNASKNAKACADFITVGNNDHAIARVIEYLDKKEIPI